MGHVKTIQSYVKRQVKTMQHYGAPLVCQCYGKRPEKTELCYFLYGERCQGCPEPSETVLGMRLVLAWGLNIIHNPGRGEITAHSRNRTRCGRKPAHSTLLIIYTGTGRLSCSVPGLSPADRTGSPPPTLDILQRKKKAACCCSA